jgi:hypothetical protein
MKKYIFLIIIILLAGCAKKPVYQTIPVKDRSATLSLTNINVGTTPNDGTGQTIRSAFQTINTNNDLTEAAIATVPTIEEVRQTTNDSINDLKEKAIPSSSILFLREDADTPGEAVTYEGMVNYVAANGGTGGGGYEYTSFIVGTTTGAPSNADTAFTISDMAGDVIELYRGTTADLHKQWLNETATNGKTGYRYNSSGQIVVRPAWATNDRAYIKAVPSSGVTKITLTGGASSLLTGLRAGWKFDELSGTQVNDVLSTYTGTTNATVNQTGKFGRSHSYASASTQMATFGTDVGDLGTSDFSYSAWIYVPTLQSAYNGFIEMQSGLVSFYAMVDQDNYIRAIITFDDTNYINIVSNAAISAATWTNITVTYDRNGNGTLYVNGVAQTDVEDISAHVAVDVQSNINFRIGRGGNSTWYFNGSIDDVYLWTKVLTQDEIDDIQLGTYPW